MVCRLLVIILQFKKEKHRETQRVQSALYVSQSLYYIRKGVGQAPTAGKQTQQKPCWTFSGTGAKE
jgi:hypothetical protein